MTARQHLWLGFVLLALTPLFALVTWSLPLHPVTVVVVTGIVVLALVATGVSALVAGVVQTVVRRRA